MDKPTPTNITDKRLELLGRIAIERANQLPDLREMLIIQVENILAQLQIDLDAFNSMKEEEKEEHENI